MWPAAVVTVFLTGLLCSTGAHAQNFYELSSKTGCDSVIDPLRGECVNLNAKKENACELKGSCDLDKQIAQIAELKEGRRRLDAGEIADADRSTFEATLDHLEEELEARQEEAGEFERAARECADSRQAVYDFFDDEVIPQTVDVADDTVLRRKELLEALDKAEVLQRAAKDNRDELAGASPETDRVRYDEYVRMQEEYEKLAAAYREAELRLKEHNEAHGDPVDRYLERLIAYYKSEQAGHAQEIEQQKNRAENCGKLEYLSLP